MATNINLDFSNVIFSTKGSMNVSEEMTPSGVYSTGNQIVMSIRDINIVGGAGSIFLKDSGDSTTSNVSANPGAGPGSMKITAGASSSNTGNFPPSVQEWDLHTDSYATGSLNGKVHGNAGNGMFVIELSDAGSVIYRAHITGNASADILIPFTTS